LVTALTEIALQIPLPDIDYSFILIAVVASILGFVIPFHYRRKGIIIGGVTELSRYIDGTRFRNANKKLLSKYFENNEVSEDDLHYASEEVRTDLVIAQSLIEGNMIPKKRLFGIYSDRIIKSVDAYQKYLDEFEPQANELGPAIQKLYSSAQKWIKKD